MSVHFRLADSAAFAYKGLTRFPVLMALGT